MTSREANWDMDNDSDMKAASEDEDADEAEILKTYFKDEKLWRACDSLTQSSDVGEISPQIYGIGGTWGHSYKDSLVTEI